MVSAECLDHLNGEAVTVLVDYLYCQLCRTSSSFLLASSSPSFKFVLFGSISLFCDDLNTPKN